MSTLNSSNQKAAPHLIDRSKSRLCHFPKTTETAEGDITGWTLQTKRPRLHPSPMPSLRYINLIRTGAKQNGFPDYYQAYLDGVQPYIIHKFQFKLLLGKVLVSHYLGPCHNNRSNDTPIETGQVQQPFCSVCIHSHVDVARCCVLANIWTRRCSQVNQSPKV